MLGFQRDFWNYITFAVLFVLLLSFLALFVFMLGLSGRIAMARKHREPVAVNLMGCVAFLAIVPWIQAFISVFKPSSQPRFRKQKRTTKEDIARLSGNEEGNQKGRSTEA